MEEKPGRDAYLEDMFKRQFGWAQRTLGRGGTHHVDDLNQLNTRIRGPIDEYEPRLDAVEDGDVACFFQNLTGALCAFIEGADLVAGCTAWLTSAPVLDALAKIPRVQLIVQKEDFLRPDGKRQMAGTSWHGELRSRYEKLRGISRYDDIPMVSHQLRRLRLLDDDLRAISAVRCLGESQLEASAGRHAFAPRMHHKFLVRFTENPRPKVAASRFVSFSVLIQAAQAADSCQDADEVPTPAPQADPYGLAPDAVWTGSFNPTATAAHSLENAVVIRSEKIVRRYVQEWAWALQFSEPLDWSTPWTTPEFFADDQLEPHSWPWNQGS
jgi:hypothetical protein